MRKFVFLVLLGAVFTVIGVLLYGSGGAFFEKERQEETEEEILTGDSVSEGNIPASAESGEAGTETASADSSDPEEEVFVYICGEVRNPGVYAVPASARVTDVLELAGGFTEDANRDYRNLAEHIFDAERIYIPSLSEEPSSEALYGENTAEISGTVNINTADSAALCTLPGIGEAKADAIISYREEQGPFGQPEDIMKVSGIGEALYEKLRELITV